MSDIRPCLIIVESIQGATPGPASGISYTVAVAFENGDRHTGIAGVTPDWPRYPDELNITAAKVGSRHPGFVRGPFGGSLEVLSAWIKELPAFKGCS